MGEKNTESNYRWYVISLAALTMTFCVAMPLICMSVLFNEISADLGLSLVQVGWVWGFFPLSGLFTVFIAGILADRFGARRILIFACSMVGLAGASRGLANDFIGLLFTTFLFGFSIGFITSSNFKIAATWFQPRQLGLANGIMTTGLGVGLTISSMFSASLLSPMLGGWRGVLFLYGGISVFISLLWLITIKEQQPAGITGSDKKAAPREAIYHVLRNKNVWLISLAMLGFIGCTEGMCGYLPLYLREFKQWLPASADGVLATFTGVSTLGAIPISMLSDRLGRRKLFIVSISSAAAIGIGLLSIAEGGIIWIIIILVGLGRDGLLAVTTATIIETKGIGMLYTGTAMGLIQSIYRIGPFISSPMGNSMAAIGPGSPFFVWSIFGMIALVCFALAKENRSPTSLNS
jgi:predicted MFS family arabinose efflux permease